MERFDITKLRDEGLVLVHGRYSDVFVGLNDETAEECYGISLFWTGSGLEFNVKASELKLTIYSDYDQYESWISVFVNGEMLQRLMLPKGWYELNCFRGMNPEEVKNVRIMKEGQPFDSDKKQVLKAVWADCDGVFLPAAERKLKLEFIGDSITSAEGCIGAKKDMDWIPMFFSASNSYSYLTAKKLDADYRVISQSGWGLCCSWDGNPKCNVPDYYEYICGILEGDVQIHAGAKELNDFNEWQPDFVIMNLGTNDFSAFNQPPYVLAGPDSSEIKKLSGSDDTLTRPLDVKLINHVLEDAPYRQSDDKIVFDLRLNKDGSFEKESADYWVGRAVEVLEKIRHYNPDAYVGFHKR